MKEGYVEYVKYMETSHLQCSMQFSADDRLFGHVAISNDRFHQTCIHRLLSQYCRFVYPCRSLGRLRIAPNAPPPFAPADKGGGG